MQGAPILLDGGRLRFQYYDKDELSGPTCLSKLMLLYAIVGTCFARKSEL